MKYKDKRRLLAGISIFILFIFYLFQNLSNSIRIGGFIFGLVVFYFLDYMFEIDFKLKHYYYILIILVLGILFSPLYSLYTIYDKILHFVMPIFGCLLIFHIIDKKDLSLSWKLWITFMFIISFLALHEIGEYLIDQLWGLNLQGVYIRDITGITKLNLLVSKIDDTMIDLILGVLGAMLFVVGKSIGHFYNKLKKKK